MIVPESCWMYLLLYTSKIFQWTLEIWFMWAFDIYEKTTVNNSKVGFYLWDLVMVYWTWIFAKFSAHIIIRVPLLFSSLNN